MGHSSPHVGILKVVAGGVDRDWDRFVHELIQNFIRTTLEKRLVATSFFPFRIRSTHVDAITRQVTLA